MTAEVLFFPGTGASQKIAASRVPSLVEQAAGAVLVLNLAQEQLAKAPGFDRRRGGPRQLGSTLRSRSAHLRRALRRTRRTRSARSVA
jgi:hypothetical protein